MRQNDVAVGVVAAGGGGQPAEQAEAAPASPSLSEQNMRLVEEMAAAVGQNNMLKANWSAPNKDQAARGWKGKLTCTMELSSGAEAIDHVWRFINKGAPVLKMLARDIRTERARADKAEADLARLRAELEGVRAALMAGPGGSRKGGGSQ